MLHEPASTPSDNPVSITPDDPPQDPVEEQINIALACVSDIMSIDDQFALEWNTLSLEDRAVIIQGEVDYLLTVTGRLKTDSHKAVDLLDKQLQQHQMTALFRQQTIDGKRTHIIHILDGRMTKPARPSAIPSFILLILTLASLLYIGTVTAIGEIGLTDKALAETLGQNLIPEFWRGLPYTISILLILGSHEMAHWFTMRKHGVVASLPYFIPSFIFSPFGTFGAVIVTKGAIRNRKALFDIGVSGPLAGLIFAIPILFIGLATSPVVDITGGAIEGNSITYALAKIATFGEFLPNGETDVLLNQLAWAGWTGLFVTALNLIPLGQLDGGHIIYAVMGDRARKLYLPILGIAILLTVLVSTVWIILFLLLLLMGRIYAVPLDNITPIDPMRRRLAIVMLVIFALIFIPAPISGVEGNGEVVTTVFIVIGYQIMSRMMARVMGRRK